MKKLLEEWNKLDKDVQTKAVNIFFFVLGIAFMSMSETYTMWLGEEYNLVEHKIEYTNIEVRVPAIVEESQPVGFSASVQLVNQGKDNVRPGGSRTISAKGIEFIKSNEGYSPQAYWDVNGITVGYGHKIKSTDPKWLRQTKVGNWIPKSYSHYLFVQDIDELVNNGIKYIIKDLETNGVETSMLSQGFIDGLGDMIYNCGLSGVMNTAFYSTLKRGNIKKSIALVPSTNVSCKGHKIRREKTKVLMEDS